MRCVVGWGSTAAVLGSFVLTALCALRNRLEDDRVWFVRIVVLTTAACVLITVVAACMFRRIQLL